MERKWTDARWRVEYNKKIQVMLHKRGWDKLEIEEFMDKVKPLPLEGVIMLMKRIRNQTREW